MNIGRVSFFLITNKKRIVVLIGTRLKSTLFQEFSNLFIDLIKFLSI